MRCVPERALNYPELTGVCQVGDQVYCATAELLGLGSGGWHYVLAIYGRERSLLEGPYYETSLYAFAGTNLGGGRRRESLPRLMAQADSLHGLPVAVGSLHSMLAPFVYLMAKENPSKRIVYLMSDGAALP